MDVDQIFSHVQDILDDSKFHNTYVMIDLFRQPRVMFLISLRYRLN